MEKKTPLQNRIVSFQNSVEVVDKFNRPLCILPLSIAREQKLYFRSVAITAQDKTGRFLLGLDEGIQPGFLFTEYVPAAFSYQEACEKTIQKRWGSFAIKPRFLGIWEPCGENGESFAGIFILPLSNAIFKSLALTEKNCLIADKRDISILKNSDYDLEPFFKLVFSSKLWPA